METITNSRKAGTAVNLSLLLAGLGHIYCGDLRKGLAYMAVLAVLPAVLIAGLAAGATPGFYWAVCAAALGVTVTAAVGAHRLARRTRPDYRIKEYNHWSVYLLLLLTATGGAIGYSLFIRDNFAQAFVVPNASMFPTIQAGDRILAERNVHDRRDPVLGELVIFRALDDRLKTYVKRVVGLPGETLAQVDGILTIDGVRVTAVPDSGDGSGKTMIESRGGREYATYDAQPGATGDFGPVTVPANHVFVLGDNRDRSVDSRHFGAVPIAACRGTARYLFWSGSDWSRIGRLR